MAKMYYNEAEAAAKLGITLEQLSALTRERKLQAYADGANRMYKVVDVDALAGPDLAGESDIQLTPADTGTRLGTSLGLDDSSAGTKSGTRSGTSKSDTVITSEGISIFDEEDLEIETADPMAKTQISPSLEDQISLEGVGSGSGLLDLTRESDDTSLGAEVLDHIDVEGEGASASAVAESIAAGGYETAEPAAVVEMPVVVERADPTAGAFAAVIGVGTLLMLVVGAVALAAMLQKSPGYVMSLGQNLLIVLGAGVVLAGVAAVVGYMLGKGAAERSVAAR